jgi:mRNA interferase RelE/StbE
VKYRLVYTARAVKDVERLDRKERRRVGETLKRYKENPFAYAHKLVDSTLGSYRFRIGDYRVIFDVEGDEIVVLRIGHRKQIYRKL